MSFKMTFVAPDSAVAKCADYIEMHYALRRDTNDPLLEKRFRETKHRFYGRAARALKTHGISFPYTNLVWERAAKLVEERRAYRKQKALERKAAAAEARELAQIAAEEAAA